MYSTCQCACAIADVTCMRDTAHTARVYIYIYIYIWFRSFCKRKVCKSIDCGSLLHRTYVKRLQLRHGQQSENIQRLTTSACVCCKAKRYKRFDVSLHAKRNVQKAVVLHCNCALHNCTVILRCNLHCKKHVLSATPRAQRLHQLCIQSAPRRPHTVHHKCTECAPESAVH